MKTPRTIGILLVVALLAAPAAAQPALDADQPIAINADSLEVLQPKQQAIFRGNVVAEQGNVTLKADTMIVHYRERGQGDASAVSKIEAVGNVLFASPTETARGDRGEYAVDSKQIHVFGNVVLTRDKNVLKGTKLDYNLATGRSLITGGASVTSDGQTQPGGRVQGLFVPEQKGN